MDTTATTSTATTTTHAGPISVCSAQRMDIPALVAIINAAYKVGEEGILVDTRSNPFLRVTADELLGIVDAGQLLVATRRRRKSCCGDGGDDEGDVLSDSHDVGPVGCVKIVPRAGEQAGEWGLLAVALSEQGKGIGALLVCAAERALFATGARTIQLELLTPAKWVHGHKERLRKWYTERLGYRLKTGDYTTSTTFLEKGKTLASRFELAVDAAFTVYTRQVIADGGFHDGNCC